MLAQLMCAQHMPFGKGGARGGGRCASGELRPTATTHRRTELTCISSDPRTRSTTDRRCVGWQLSARNRMSSTSRERRSRSAAEFRAGSPTNSRPAPRIRFIHNYVHAYIHICTHLRKHISTDTQVGTYMYICMCMYIHISASLSLSLYIYICMYISTNKLLQYLSQNMNTVF